MLVNNGEYSETCPICIRGNINMELRFYNSSLSHSVLHTSSMIDHCEENGLLFKIRNLDTYRTCLSSKRSRKCPSQFLVTTKAKNSKIYSA